MGRLGKPHGLKGFLGLYVDETEVLHFHPGSIVLIDDLPRRVRDLRRADRGYQVAFDDLNDRNAAEAIRNRDVFVESRRELSEEEFWTEDLVGLEVRPGGGTVAEVIFGPTQDRLVIDRDGVRFEVPFVDALVPRVDLDAGFVEVVEIDGLIPPPGR